MQLSNCHESYDYETCVEMMWALCSLPILNLKSVFKEFLNPH